jgi:hypothetical protein
VSDQVDISGKFDAAPIELQQGIAEFWPEEHWNEAAAIAELESGWDAFAEANTTDPSHPCGSYLRVENGVRITAERSIGWFQINACNIPPDWRAEHLFNTRHNCGTAHQYWVQRGWRPWFFSASKLGLLRG